MVGGAAAIGHDFLVSQAERAPYAVGLTLFASGAILFLLFGSLIIPIKAVIMTLLSITASFGAMVWIFQEGNLADVLHFTPLGYTIAGNPIIMFSVIFGLSMDYEVLLLSRIQEAYRRTGDNTASVAEGLSKTAGVITGAALIMVSVFAAFALAEVITIKSIGVGMAIAVAVDATIVRVLLVPATMRLMGKWNWWAPGFLGRFADRLGFSHVEDDDDARPTRTRRPARPEARRLLAPPAATAAVDGLSSRHAPDPRRRDPPETVDRLRALSPELEVVDVTGDAAFDARTLVDPEVEILIGARPPTDLAGTPKLRWLQVRSAGVDHLAADPPWRKGLLVTNAKGVYAVPIGEYVSGMVLRTHQPAAAWSADQAAHRWPDGDPPLIDPIRGKTAVIAGYGSIGREVARQLAALGMRIIAVKPRPEVRHDASYRVPGTGDPDGSIPERIVGVEAFVETVREADVLVLTMPLTDASRGIVGRELIAALPSHAWLINVSRGALVDEPALLAALRAGGSRAPSSMSSGRSRFRRTARGGTPRT